MISQKSLKSIKLGLLAITFGLFSSASLLVKQVTASSGVNPQLVSFEGESLPGSTFRVGFKYPSNAQYAMLQGGFWDSQAQKWVIVTNGWQWVNNGSTLQKDKVSYVTGTVPSNQRISDQGYFTAVQGAYWDGSKWQYTSWVMNNGYVPGLSLPFEKGATWYVCQGYNNNNISHNGFIPLSLDLTVRKEDVSTNGCWGQVNASKGRNVRAPGTGTVSYISSSSAHPRDLVCLNLDAIGDRPARSVLLGHLVPNFNLQKGTRVNQGALIGTVRDAKDAGVGGYAHIHITAFANLNCSGTNLAFENGNKLRFSWGPNLPSNGKYNQYQGTALTRPFGF